MLTYKTGDLWQAPRTSVCPTVITTNGIVRYDGQCVMGRGIARQARDSIPGLACELGQLIQRNGNQPYVLGDNIWSMPVKHRWQDKADLSLIEDSLDDLEAMTIWWEPSTIRFPRPGCGNGQLDWASVQPLMKAFSDHVIATIEVWSF